MALGKHIDADALIRKSQDHPVKKHLGRRQDLHDNPYTSRYDVDVEIPKYQLPAQGVDGKVVYQLLHDELELDGNPNMNLASFVHTWVPEECTKLVTENLNKNLVDQDEYPAAQQIHERCISMISHLWHAPKDSKAMGTATTGSSEAIMLGGLALKKRWQEKMKAKGKSIHEPGPNIVMGAEAQVALEKFARYFEVECRLVPISKEGAYGAPQSNYVMSAENAMQYVDENTIGVFVILGSTYTGGFESVQLMSDALDKYEAESGNHIPIHVDAASGGFVAPFAYPDYVWDFKIPRVQSINASGHKYGMSTVGVGWIIWRGQEFLPKELIFELHYLGATDYSFNLNFSRPAHPILAQMFNFLNLGFAGYRRIMQNDLAKSRLISRALENSGYFLLLSDIHRPKPASTGEAISSAAHKIYHGRGPIDEEDAEFYHEGLPVVSFRFTDEIKAQNPNLKQAWMQTQLRTIGWIVPNYGLAPNCEDTEILRVVVRESLSGDLARKLVSDIMECAETLLNDAGPSYSMSVATQQKDFPKSSAIKKEDAEHISNNQSTYAKPC
ncbi:glutamate decarboxylase, partial [Tremellales sp. Uapishka_1]